MGLSFIALTDHDTVGGVAPALAAARDFPGLRVIPGVELSTEVPQGEVHILGYFIDYTDEEFLARLERMRNSRLERAQAMIARLSDLVLDIEYDKKIQILLDSSLQKYPQNKSYQCQERLYLKIDTQ